jgi:hypothetical protein
VPERGILCFKPASGFEERGSQIQENEYQRVGSAPADRHRSAAGLPGSEISVPERGILCFKPASGFEERGSQIQEKEYQRDHRGRR